MIYLAIDPGPERSAWCEYDSELQKPLDADILDNCDLLSVCRLLNTDSGKPYKNQWLLVEGMACYGMAVGASVFTTVLWSGRFIEASQLPWHLVYRKDVKMHLCGNMQSKDPNIRRALLDRFGEKGTKKNPGVLYGYKDDMFSALAIAVTYCDRKELQP
jgi:hypothetical protein